LFYKFICMQVPDSIAATEVIPRLRTEIARMERLGAPLRVLPFGDARVDSRLPLGGLPLGRLHEVASDPRDLETPAAAAGFTACLAQRTAPHGEIVWVLQRDDLYAPGLQAFGVKANRLIFVRENKDEEILAVLEDALRTRGVDAAIGEIGSLPLTASRRLQLACECRGATGFVLQRCLYAASGIVGVSAATTRWRISPVPSETHEPGLGSPRWRTRLERCRGGRAGAWIMEAQDEKTGDVRVVAELADHETEARGRDGGSRARDDGAFGQCASVGGRR
jgi:protein ImuA